MLGVDELWQDRAGQKMSWYEQMVFDIETTRFAGPSMSLEIPSSREKIKSYPENDYKIEHRLLETGSPWITPGLARWGNASGIAPRGK